jgi:hypothetical protein
MMGGRGGSGRSSAGLIQVPVVDAKALADMDLRDAYENAIDAGNVRYQTTSFQGPWITLDRLRTALKVLGWDQEKQDREITRFIREGKALSAPYNNQQVMTDAERRAAIRLGNQEKHIISFYN